MTNLRNYVNLSPDNAERLELGGTAFNKTGNGSGMLGVPGDFTPPSRFVRTAMLAHFSNKPKDAPGAVNLAAHVLNSVDIPRGVVKSREKDLKNVEDYTQWVVIKDLTGRALYIRCYDGMAFRKIDMKKVTFEKGLKTKPAAIESGDPGVIDITSDLTGL
jgi:choloylglycine hydrolase